MKIIQVINSLWNGGAEKLVVDLSNELAKTEEVIICSFRKLDPAMHFVKNISNNVRIISLDKKTDSV
jgi:hypothetical protein